MEASNLPGTEFKTLVIRMLQGLRGRTAELSVNFNKEIVSVKKGIETIKNQLEMKSTTEKNILEGINSRLDEAED